MDISKHTFNDVIEFLKKEGYKCTLEEGEGKYTLVNIVDNETIPDAKYYKDYGYMLHKFKTKDDLDSDIGCIFCGGLYTALGMFMNNKNICYMYTNIKFNIPPGNKLINDEEENE